MKFFSDTLDKNDKMWEIISLLLLFTNALIIAFSLPKLPEIIPIHFNMAGEANGWGNKNTLWLIFVITIPVYSLLTFLSKRPEFYNTRFTENNVEEQKRLTSRSLRTMKAIVCLIFLIVTVFMIQTAQGKWLGYIEWLLPVILLLVFAPTFYYLIKFSKIR